MTLTYNETLKRYEFKCTRTERDGKGVLGLALATSAKFKTAWNGREPIFYSNDPFRARQLFAHADMTVRQRIEEHVQEKGGEVPVLTWKDGVYIWSGPMEANGILYKDIPRRADFVFTRTPALSLPRGAGAGYEDPVWWTEKSMKAARCADYADEAARLAIGEAMARRNAALEASRAEDSDIDLPVPAGLTPYPYQRGGVAYARPRKNVLFGDEMGLGKTIEAILWANLVAEELGRTLKILVICPATLKRNWMKELAGDPLIGKPGWLYRPATIGIADTRYPRAVPPTDIVIINYEMLALREDTGQRKTVKAKNKEGEPIQRQKKIYNYRLRDSLKVKWDMLIVDECHRLKGDPKEVVRSRMAFAIEAERMAFLSGTPMVNRPRELWNIVHHLAPKQFPDKAAFMERYCKGGNNYTDIYAGATNLPELQERLRLWIMVRRLKRDVLKDLPPKMRQVIELPADGVESFVRSELIAFQAKETVLTHMRLKVELAKASDRPEDYATAVRALTEGIKVAFEELSRVRRETAVAKIPMVTEHVANILAEGHKVLLFCHHKEVVNKIATTFRKETVVLTGDTPLGARERAVTDFQTNDRVRLFIGTIGAAGVGLTLTASSYVVFAELDWVPGNVTQAEDRAHRIGQNDSVSVQHLVLEGSLDKRMADVLVEKQDVADRALDRESADEMLAEPILPDREKMATQGVSVKDIARLAERLSSKDIAAIHMGLKLLAGTHKDAGILDGLTFRAVDAPLGKILAGTKKLNPKMAALGRKFLVKYRETHLNVVPEIQALFSKEKEKE